MCLGRRLLGSSEDGAECGVDSGLSAGYGGEGGGVGWGEVAASVWWFDWGSSLGGCD